MILAFDPGKNLGIAHVSESGQLLKQLVVAFEVLTNYPIPEESQIIIGNGTGLERLCEFFDQQGLRYQVVDETGTSLEARRLYFKDHPPKGFMRYLPQGLLSPPELIDGYAAYAIALRYLSSDLGNS